MRNRSAGVLVLALMLLNAKAAIGDTIGTRGAGIQGATVSTLIPAPGPIAILKLPQDGDGCSNNEGATGPGTVALNTINAPETGDTLVLIAYAWPNDVSSITNDPGTPADAWQEVPGAAATTKAGVETIWYAPNVRGNGSQHGFVVHSSANNLIDPCVFVVRGLAVKPIDQAAKIVGSADTENFVSPTISGSYSPEIVFYMNGGGSNRPFSVNNGFNIISQLSGSSDAMGGLPGGYLVRNVRGRINVTVSQTPQRGLEAEGIVSFIGLGAARGAP